MKLSYSISNLRSLKQLPLIELKPITLLVGRNSAGKSTFLRSLPLLRQSLEVRSSAPILWYGEHVDFGDFKSAVYRHDTQNEITFRFDVSNFDVRLDVWDAIEFSGFYIQNGSQRTRRRTYDALIELSIGEVMSRTVKKRINIYFPDHETHVDVTFEKDGLTCQNFTINGFSIDTLTPTSTISFTNNGLFGAPNIVIDAKLEGRPIKKPVSILNFFSLAIVRLFENKVDGRISHENRLSEAKRILQKSSLSRDSLQELAMRADIISFKRLYLRWLQDPQDPTFEKINTLWAASYSLHALQHIGSALADLFRSVTYLGPARARSERFYRHQELEVSEITPDGKNLPMFLNALSQDRRDRFSNWVKSLFGYGVTVQADQGHVRIELEKQGLFDNVADTGYGVSQLLPVLAQIWSVSQLRQDSFSARFTKRMLRPVAMEQPELHLHPAHQARLADALADAISGKHANPYVRFVIETHSEALINRLGQLIEERAISHNDVSIIVFSDEGGESHASTSEYTDKGVLKKWPHGFFNYS